MTDERDLRAVARAIIDANFYLVLGTADESASPWVSPVYYAPSAYHEFFWVSEPEARHSRNVAARPQVSAAIFDSSAPIGTGQAVYMSGVAQELVGDECERGIDVFSRRSLEHGGPAWTSDDVSSRARHRLYRLTALEHYVLDANDRRASVTP